MAEDWFYTQQGQQVGPVSPDQLRQLVATGSLPPGELVWRDGLSSWIPAHTVPGLFTPQQLAAGLPPAPSLPGGTPVQSYDYHEPRRGLRDDEDDDERHAQRRRKRKKKKKQVGGMPGGLKAALIAGGCLFGGILLIVLIVAVVMPLFSTDNLRSFAGTYPVHLEPNKWHKNNVYFKQGQWVTVTVTNSGGLAMWDFSIRDPNNNPVVVNKSKQGLQLSGNFEVRQSGDYEITVYNLGPNECGFVVAYNGNKQSL